MSGTHFWRKREERSEGVEHLHVHGDALSIVPQLKINEASPFRALATVGYHHADSSAFASEKLLFSAF